MVIDVLEEPGHNHAAMSFPIGIVPNSCAASCVLHGSGQNHRLEQLIDKKLGVLKTK
jgi:hypothetical protein